MAISLKSIRKRADRAFGHRAKWDTHMRDIYDYVIPYRNAYQHRSDTFVDQVFDSTAIKAAMRFSGRMQTDFTPPGEQFFSLEAGIGLKSKDRGQAKAYTEIVEAIAAADHAALVAGNFDMASHEMYSDLFAGTAGLMINRGAVPGSVVCQSVPIYELGLEAGPYGDIWGRYWEKSYPAEQLPEMWPKGVFGDALKSMIDKEGDKPIKIVQGLVWSASEQQWGLTVYCADKIASKSDEDRPIWTEQFAVSPLITPRFFVVPGETFGRGPASMALPQIRVINKVQELALKAAGLALLGVWLRRTDAAFNVDTARFEPGALWEVSSTNGPLGPAMQRLDIPANFDVSSFVIQDQRESLRALLLDETLPPDSGAVRSATEIMERMKRLNQDLGGVLGRLTLEIIKPVVQRVTNILFVDKVIPQDIPIDTLNTSLRVLSPISRAQGANKAKAVVDYATILGSLVGPDRVIDILKYENVLPQLGRWLGIDEKDLRSEEEGKLLQNMIQQQAAAMAEQMAKQQAKAQPAQAAANGATL